MPLNPKDKSQIAKADIVAEKVRRLYLLVIRELVKHTRGLKIDPEKPFNFTQHPRLKAKLEEILKRLSKQVVSEINKATSEEWQRAVEKNNELLASYIKRNLLTPEQITAYTGRNLEALKQFQKRKINGLPLSEKIWKYSKQFRSELEMGLDLGLQEGKSASQLSRDLRRYLEEPNRLYRRVRDKHGNLHLSKQAKKYRPGTGVYRSSYKNAMRLTRTEINMSYRASDYEKYNQFDFVLGYEIKRSNKKFGCGICEKLKGKYPKGFKFLGWHPQCRCYTEPILNSEDDFIKQQKAILEGKEYIPSKQINDVPKHFKKWINDNEEKLTKASLPFFLKDNELYWKEKPNFITAKRYSNGGRVSIHNEVNKKSSDYKDLITIANQFAKKGSKVELTPRIHFKDPEYNVIYKSLKNTRYYRKCPDLKIDGVFYEYENFIPPFKYKKIGSMITHGVKQSNNIIIKNTNGASLRGVKRMIERRLRDKSFTYELSRVYIYEKGKILSVYEKL